MIRDYVKKPVPVKAMALNTPDDLYAAYAWLRNCGAEGRLEMLSLPYDHESKIVIETLEGEMEAKVGHWIVQGVVGEFYPVRDDIFTATYVEAKED